MHDYYRYRDHPIAVELESRISRICRRLAASEYDPAGLYRAQKSLLSELLSVEDGIKTFRRERTEIILKANQVAISAKEAGRSVSNEEKDRIGELQVEAEHLGDAIRLLRFGRWLLRYVADGIAWRIYGHRRYMIRALGAKQPIAFLSDKKGLDNEVEAFVRVRRRGRDWLPLLHDLTNCIRTADLSIFKSGDLYDIIELKSGEMQTLAMSQPSGGRHSGRVGRQQQRLERITKYFRSGNLADLQPAMTGKLLRANVTEIYNFAAITKVLGDARSQGFGIVEPERGLLYLSWDLAKSSEADAISAAVARFGHIFSSLFTFRSISPRFEAYHWSLPITAMELQVDDILDLLFGNLALIVMVNYAELQSICQEVGVDLRVAHDGIDTRLLVNIGSHTGQVGEGFWDRITMEGLTLHSFCMMLKAIEQHVMATPVPQKDSDETTRHIFVDFAEGL